MLTGLLIVMTLASVPLSALAQQASPVAPNRARAEAAHLK
jgi:hypothetical protein